MTSERPDERRIFLVQDPDLRASIMPLFAIDTRDLAARPQGRGTTFRTDPWGACATAFHVIEELLEPRGQQAVLKEHARLIALELEGVPYGAASIQPEQWRTFEGMFVLAGIQSDPGHAPRLRNLTELAALSISRSPGAGGEAKYLGLDFCRWRPEIGAWVTALGFADLDIGAEGPGDVQPISQYLYGSHATITDIEPADPSRGRPWPFFRVDRDWPGGMSGGPVLNEAGLVIGMVSTGMSFAASGSAVYFSGSGVSEQMFPYLDPGAPNHIYCWGGFDNAGQVAMIAPTREALLAMPGTADLQDIGALSFNPANGDYICV